MGEATHRRDFSEDVAHFQETGDGRHLGPLITHYEPRLRSYVATRLGWHARSDIDDVLQDVHAKATKGLATFDFKGDVENLLRFLYTIAGNCVKDYGRRRRVREPAPDDVNDMPSASMGPEEELLAKEDAEQATVRLNELRGACRDDDERLLLEMLIDEAEAGRSIKIRAAVRLLGLERRYVPLLGFFHRLQKIAASWREPVRPRHGPGAAQED